MREAKKSLLLVIRHSPYGSSLAKASVDLALAAAAFDQAVNLLFMGDGVLQLMPNQDGHAVGAKTIGRQLASLPLYDIDHVYVDTQAASSYNLDLEKVPVPTRLLDNGQIHHLMCSSDHVLGF